MGTRFPPADGALIMPIVPRYPTPYPCLRGSLPSRLHQRFGLRSATASKWGRITKARRADVAHAMDRRRRQARAVRPRPT